MTNIHPDISLAVELQDYGVRGVSVGGCVDGNRFGTGPGAMGLIVSQELAQKEGRAYA